MSSAGSISSAPQGPLCIGHGYDIHRLKRGGRLVLGGVEVAGDLSAIAHSDGDVVIHAIVDALLGAMCWGDIGGRFPDTDPQYKEVPSSFFLKDVHGAVRSAGYHILNVDVTILAQKPRIAPFRSRMIDCLQQMLDAPVSIKAGTNEGCDSVGHGEAIAAHAVVLLARD